MPETGEGVLLFVGAVFLLIGILGGGFEVSAIKIPAVGKAIRIVCGGIGLVLMGLSMSMYLAPLFPARPSAAPATSGVPSTTEATNPPGEAPIPTEVPTALQPERLGAVVFSEDFEDEEALAATFIEDANWQRVSDDTGNVVFDVDNLAGLGYPQMRFGSRAWEDYAVEFRARIVDFVPPTGKVYCNFRIEDAWYSLFLEPSNPYDQINLGYSQSPSGWDPLGSSPIRIEKGVWYPMRIEAQRERLRVFLDDNLIIESTDSRRVQGDVSLGVGPGTHAQFDDIRVLSPGE